jgi:hypothetical protein
MTNDTTGELEAAGYPAAESAPADEVVEDEVAEEAAPEEEPETREYTTGSFYNAGDMARDWPDLQDPETGTTLYLEPGEEVEDLVVPVNFTCSYLRPLNEKVGS